MQAVWSCQRVLRRRCGHLQVPNNEKNALLSDEAKSFMAVLAKEFPDMCVFRHPCWHMLR